MVASSEAAYDARERGEQVASANSSDDAAAPRCMAMTDKRALRMTMRARRDALLPGGPIPVANAFTARLGAGTVVAAYHPVGSEADPAAFVTDAREAGCIIALPHVVDRATPLRFLAHDGALEDGPFRLRQPAAHCVEVIPDIILTPLVAFDRAGNRLGQGAGHYDRAFAALPGAWRVGIAWSAQEVERLDADPWDMPLQAVATEREWIVP